MSFRIGHGFDVHALIPGDFLMLGGVRIAHSKQFLAHSDGDVLLHALCDALLGAAGLGDIGQHFPDSDPQYAGIASTVLLKQVYQKITRKYWAVENIDATIIAQAPKLSPYLDKMRGSIADTLHVSSDAINIKATTTEQLGYLGRSEGIAAHVVALVKHT